MIVPLLVAYFLWVHRQYAAIAEKLRIPPDVHAKIDCRSAEKLHNHAVVLVGSIDRRIVRALQYAQAISADSIEAVYVDATGESARKIRAAWDQLDCGLPLTVLESPYREIVEPICTHIQSIPRPSDDDVITVIIPQFVPQDWADLGGVYVYRAGLRHLIKRALLFERNVIVVDVPYYLRPESPEPDTPGTALG